MDHALKCAMQEQAKAAILDGKWEQLRFLGNRFERAGCYAEAWNALAERVEKNIHSDPADLARAKSNQ